MHSTNFIGWYVDKTNRTLGIAKIMHISNISPITKVKQGLKQEHIKLKRFIKVARKTASNKKIFDRQLKNACSPQIRVD